MASYDITSPDGQKYRISAPDDATQEQVLAYAQKNFKLASAPAKAAPATTPAGFKSTYGEFSNTLKDALLAGGNATGFQSGLGQGFLDVVNTAAKGGAYLRDLFGSKGGNYDAVKADIDASNADYEKNAPSGAAAGRLTSNIAATLPVGGLLGKAAGALGASPAVATALSSSGMTTGKVLPEAAKWLGAKGADMALRTGTSGAVGFAAGGLLNPDDAAASGKIGAMLPGGLKVVGSVANAIKPFVKTNAGDLLAKAIGATPQEAQVLARAAMNAPESILDGSKLTFAQALAHQGVRNPNVGLLENIASGAPGGNVLLNRYGDQARARTQALNANGADSFFGAAADLSERTGSHIGSILRTQALDDSLAAQRAWKGGDGNGGVYAQALKDDVRLTLPLEAMQDAMNPLGRGSVIEGKDARRVLAKANEIGTLELPAMEALKTGRVDKSQSLEQAVRGAGGIKGKGGELKLLGIKESGTTGLINNKSGKSLDDLAHTMWQRGYIANEDPYTLLEALHNGGGRKLFANDRVETNASQRLRESMMGDSPGAEKIPVSVPFDEFQRLRRDSGTMAAAVAEKTGGATEGGVLSNMNGLLTKAADDAAVQGNGLLGTNMSPEFLAQYNAARDLTRKNAELYKGGNNISSILRKPYGQEFTLNGNEITNKLWHGGSGLLGDVQNLKNTLNSNNFNPALDALRSHVMTEAASKTKASGDFGAALPKYVADRYPALQELLHPDQFNAMRNVALDIRNAEKAAYTGIRGSDTAAKISRALDSGFFDTGIAKTIGKFTTLKGFGGENFRAYLSKMATENKGKLVSDLLANPKAAAAALQDADFVLQLDKTTLKRLSSTAKLAVATAPAITVQ